VPRGVALGLTVREYRELEAGTRWPSSTVWERMVALYGWPQTFVVDESAAPYAG